MSFSTISNFLPRSILQFTTDTLGIGKNLFSATDKETTDKETKKSSEKFLGEDCVFINDDGDESPLTEECETKSQSLEMVVYEENKTKFKFGPLTVEFEKPDKETIQQTINQIPLLNKLPDGCVISTCESILNAGKSACTIASNTYEYSQKIVSDSSKIVSTPITVINYFLTPLPKTNEENIQSFKLPFPNSDLNESMISTIPLD